MKIYDRIHQLCIQFSVTPEVTGHVYVYIIVGKEGCYLMNTGVRECDKKIGEYTHKFGKNRENIDVVLLTHSHSDHIGALKSIKERYSCCIYAGRGERDWIEDIDLQYEKRPIPGFYGLVNGSIPVGNILSDEGLLYLEPGITIRVTGAPGHSRESLCFYYREEEILFTGDAILDPSDTLIYENSHIGEATLRRLEGLEEVDLYCPTWDEVYDRRTGVHMIHGGHSKISKIREYTEAYRGRVQEESPQELFESICKESSMAEYRKNPMFMRSVIPDLSRLNQEDRRDREGLDMEECKKRKKLKVSVDIC